MSFERTVFNVYDQKKNVDEYEGKTIKQINIRNFYKTEVILLLYNVLMIVLVENKK